ncbi:haloacid dehalogenase [Xylanimonas oleitrophica]|uniref:Haloacid dehalogenase n=1 Tax=Xylanimonas oleitrophica TaxID=2607479 RepID=A0A2W5YCJ9_9MICO|nr:HAD family hydrolase [Xylanimonas oleitrophica]PZR51871.1 haloacid dehalogenase [Xylanimonas oleitrophica]
MSSAPRHPQPRPSGPAAAGRGAALPRLVATDLDGTLLRSDGTVSDRTRRVLAAVEDAGVEVVFVTARPPRWLDVLAGVVGRHGRVICLGGAAVWDLEGCRPHEVQGFDDDEALRLVADLRDAVPGVRLAFERVDGPVFDPGFTSAPGDLDDPAWRATVETTLGAGAQPVAKILARAGQDEPEQARPGQPADGPAVTPLAGDQAQDVFFDRVRGVVGRRAHLAYSGAAGLAELLAPQVTKDAALARWCARLGIDAADVWAFGDMPNDVPMLRWAGRGLAVAGAHPDVKACADGVVGGNDEDGVAAALEEALAAPR